MAVISLLVFDSSKLPSFEVVRAKAKAQGGTLELYEAVDLARHQGYLPVRLSGRTTGFEYYFDAVPEGALPPEATEFGSHHIVTRTFGDMEEGRAAIAFLQVVAPLAGAAYVYPDDGIVVAPEQVEDYLAAQVEEFSRVLGGVKGRPR